MAVRSRIPSIAQTVQAIIDRRLSPEAQSRQFATIARTELAKAEAQNTRILGYKPEHETYVDGVKGAREETVKPDGIILYEFADALRIDVLRYIGDQLEKAAPKGKSGRYMRSFRVFADGIMTSNLTEASNAERIIFSSVVPYARKIEGKPQIPGYPNPPQSPQAAAGVFHAVAALAKKRYGNQAAIKFTLTDVEAPGTELEQWAGKTTLTRKRFKEGSARHQKARSQWLRRQPAISVSFR